MAPASDQILLCIDSPSAPTAQALALLSADERARAARFHFDADRHRFQSARILLRRLLSRHGGSQRAPQDWRFVVGEWGRPRLTVEQGGDRLHFNVSHARSAIACVLSGNPLCGVDVEDRVPDDFASLADDFFAPAESAWLRGADSVLTRAQRFLMLWTLKESWVKARGTGLATGLQRFCILPGEDGRLALKTDAELEADPSAWHFHHAIRADGTHLAIALRQPGGFSITRIEPGAL
ncbi:4'-phosphopantetheinyl transferase family protein [Methyloversatilis thermotolerans]|uniref:4'-phosphopantetheinyl transferase family protein n=1 Tax=Methyloversatilis thermotolerans TaxID=1346290 RepID=UPI00036C1075|nr:4'-phosphopantetheinyl transferase superfamily protein [Methyloversatilis thermotolerans]